MRVIINHHCSRKSQNLATRNLSNQKPRTIPLLKTEALRQINKLFGTKKTHLNRKTFHSPAQRGSACPQVSSRKHWNPRIFFKNALKGPPPTADFESNRFSPAYQYGLKQKPSQNEAQSLSASSNSARYCTCMTLSLPLYSYLAASECLFLKIASFFFFLFYF